MRSEMLSFVGDVKNNAEAIQKILSAARTSNLDEIVAMVEHSKHVFRPTGLGRLPREEVDYETCEVCSRNIRSAIHTRAAAKAARGGG